MYSEACLKEPLNYAHTSDAANKHSLMRAPSLHPIRDIA